MTTLLITAALISAAATTQGGLTNFQQLAEPKICATEPVQVAHLDTEPPLCYGNERYYQKDSLGRCWAVVCRNGMIVKYQVPSYYCTGFNPIPLPQ